MIRVARLLAGHRPLYWLAAAMLSLLAGTLTADLARRHEEAVLRAGLAAWSDRECLVLRGTTEDSRAMGAVRLAGRVNAEVKTATGVSDVNVGRLTRPAADALAVLTDHVGAELSFIVNREGRIVSDWNRGDVQPTSIGQDVRGREYFRQAMRGRSSVFIATSLTAGRRSVFLSAPIYAGTAEDGPIIGVISSRYLADHIDRFLGSRLDVTGLLISPHGVVMAASEPSWVMTLAGPALPARTRWLAATRQYGHSFDDPARVASLPFDPAQPTVTVADRRHAAVARPIDWGDPAGPWQLVYVADLRHALSLTAQLAIGALAALIAFALQAALLRHLAQRVARHALEQRLVAQEHRYLTIIARTPVGIGVIADERVQVANPALRQLIGVRVGEPWPDVYADQASRDRATAMLRGGEPREGDMELALLDPDGQRHDCLAIFLPVALQQRGLLLWLTDLTDQIEAEADIRRARQAAENATRLRADFLANMSHELRTPMNAIIGMSDLALETELDARQRNYVEKARDAAGTLLGVIDDILDFSRIEAGRLTLEHIPFELGEVLDHAVQVLGLGLEQKGVELLLNVPPEVPAALVGDPLRLGQVLTQLGKQAARVTGEGEVVIAVMIAEPAGSAEPSGPGGSGDSSDCIEPGAAPAASDVLLQFSVSDGGPGLTPAQLAQLRRQLDEAEPAAPDGSGLGLAICRQLVDMMGGRLWVETMPGVGSTFHFAVRVGLQDAGHGEDAAAGAGIAAAARTGARVLVVDDSRVARELLAGLCRAQGLAPETAGSGRAALRMARAAALAGRPFDWMLIDWHMPEMNGLSTAALMLDEFAQPPRIVLVTAFSNDETLYEAMSRLPTGHRPPVLAKPVTAAMLRSVLGASPPAESAGAAQARRQAATRAAMRALAGARILVVDDIAVNRDLAEDLLSRAGVSVALAANGAIALDLLRQSPDGFDGVLMDCQMPEMDGYEATRRLREDPRWQALPVIALTANATGADRVRILATGMNDHIAKPLHADALFQTLARWVRPRAAGAADGSDAAEMADPARESAADDEEMAAADGPLCAEAPSPVPAIEGLEARTGLATAANNTALYLRLLRVFHHTQQATAARLDEAADEQDPQPLERLAHALRGASATIGAMTLCEAATALEEACRAGAPATRRRELAATASAALRRLLQGLDQTLQALPVPPPPSLPPGVLLPGADLAPSPADQVARLMADLARWRRQLASHDGIAAETADTLARTLDRMTSGLDPACAAQLREAAQAAARFDFEAALQLLDAAVPPANDEQAAVRASRPGSTP